jgi:hypothetical protein
MASTDALRLAKKWLMMSVPDLLSLLEQAALACCQRNPRDCAKRVSDDAGPS